MAVTATILGRRHSTERKFFPMLWYLAGPFDGRGFEGDGSVKAAGDGAVNDSLHLFVEQRDHLPLRSDRPLQPPVRPVQKPTDGDLFLAWRHWHVDATQAL